MAYGKLKVDIIESSTEALTLPTAGGTNGQVLTTDGNGALSFEDNATKTDLTVTGNGTSLTIESSSGNNVALPAATTSAWGVMTDEDKTKLDAIETSATADQTGSEIKAAYEGESDTNAFTDADHTKLDGIETSADVTDTTNVVAALTAGTNVAIANDGTISSTDTTYSVGDGGLSQVSFTTADNTKLDGIETAATADQTAAEIRTAVGSATDSNVFTDADHTKLDGISASANNYSISSDLLDEDDFTTNSATKPASQQSIKAYVDSEVTALIGGAPGALDTLNELAASIGDDSDYAATMTTALGLKAPAASPTFTGTVAIPNVTDLESAVTANTAKVTNVTTDLAVSRSGSAFTVSSSDGTNASLPLADTDNWGLMSDEQFDKLAAIETSATADQTGSEIKTAYEGESDTNAFTDADHSKLDGIEASADVTDTANVVAALTAGTNVAIANDGTISSTDTTYSVGDGGLSQVNFTTADNTKLDGIETSATADQTGAEIKAAYEGESDTNAFTDADHSKLDAIEASATADQTNAEIRAAVEAATDSNVFTDSDHTKLDAIETSATADQTGAEIKAAYEAESDTNAFTDADHTKLDAIEASADVTDTANVVAALTAGTNVSIGTGGTISSTDTTYTSGTNISIGTDGTISSTDTTYTAGTNVAISTSGVISSTDTTYSVGDGGLTQVSFTTADNTKLDGIETSATADQTAAEIRTAVGSATDSNVFTDADHSKLDGISASANNYSISSDLLDEDNFATNSATKPASQQSIKSYVDSEIISLIGGAPGALDTLNELAASIGDDSDYAATITTALGLKAPTASPTFTGTVAIPNVSNLESAVTANTAKVTADATNVLAALASATLDCGTYAT